MSTPDPWDEIYNEEEVKLSQESKEAEEACEGMSDSGTSSEPEVQPPCWWAQILRSALSQLGYQWPIQSKQLPITVVSGCTGSGAELEAMKAGFWW